MVDVFAFHNFRGMLEDGAILQDIAWSHNSVKKGWSHERKAHMFDNGLLKFPHVFWTDSCPAQQDGENVLFTGIKLVVLDELFHHFGCAAGEKAFILTQVFKIGQDELLNLILVVTAEKLL